MLISLGVENPTDSQITDYLNSVNGEVSKERAKVADLKASADKAEELQKQLDEINNRDLTELQKAQRDFEVAQKEIETLKAQMKRTNIQKGLAEKGIIGDEANAFVDSLMAGEFNAEAFGTIFDSAKKSAVSEYEKKMLDETPNPIGGNGGTPTKTEAECVAENYAKSFGEATKKSSDIVNAYM